ncbi:MAG: DNA repair protein RecN [Firmicutes bacterium]|nr:DNA repair protein RecN [Bacillota bacterium]
MLRVLEVQNLALIDNLAFYPGEGLNVITGETGAGKSMLLDALGLLLGERATADVIRGGAESALLQAVFTRTLPDGSGEEELIFSREVRRSGPNICRINGRVEPLSEMARTGSQLVDLHGQNKQQSLLAAATQRDLLDAYGGEELLQTRAEVTELYRQVQKNARELEKLGGGEAAAAREADFLRFQLQEITAAALSEEEEAELEGRFRRLANARQLLEYTGRIYAGLYEDAHDNAVVDRLGVLAKELAAAVALDGSLAELLAQVESAAEQLQDAARQLQYYRDSISLDEAELQEVMLRLETYRKMKKKYGPTVLDVAATAERLQKELAELENRSARREALAAEQKRYAAKLAEAADRLTALRKKTAAVLAGRITEAMQEVALQGASFAVAVEPELQIGPYGRDRIEFLLSANVGEPLRSLAKTASGGEISRVMLAIKSVLAVEDEVETLIFDEIDAGIGGLTVGKVAEKLQQLAQHRQVICVTHQPVIAAAADNHFVLYKESAGGRTFTRIKQLTAAEREQEVARMLGSRDATALAHARELLRRKNKR